MPDRVGNGTGELIVLLTTILDPADARADELAVAYHERWELETGHDQLKTHLRGPGKILRSRLPDLVHQEICAYLIVHHALCALIAKASAAADLDPDRISFAKTLRLIRTATGTADIPPADWADALPAHLDRIAALLIPERQERTCPRAVKRARDNQHRVKKPGEPASIRHAGPATSTCTASTPAQHDQLKLRGIGSGAVDDADDDDNTDTKDGDTGYRPRLLEPSEAAAIGRHFFSRKEDTRMLTFD